MPAIGRALSAVSPVMSVPVCGRSAIRCAAVATSAAGCLLLAAAHAQAPRSPATLRPEILECVVYSDTDPTKRHDCTAKARELCAASAGSCELPIGLVLTGGRDLDGDRETWEKVRVSFRCGEHSRANGPHHQNDHATALLACGGF